MEDDEKRTLFIKHLPNSLTTSEKEELFRCFGADNINVMSSQGQFKNTAFVSFPNRALAKSALLQLHQVEVLGSIITAEYARKNSKYKNTYYNNSENEDKPAPPPQKEVSHVNKDGPCQYCKRLPPIAPHFGLDYASNPGLTYKYPNPNADVLLNICSALLSVPKFYTQVLHLMNKMNLYPPFTPASVIPSILIDAIYSMSNLEHNVPPNFVSHPTKKQSSESEMEDEELEASQNKFNKPVPERVIESRNKRKRTIINSSNKSKLLEYKATEIESSVTTAQADSHSGGHVIFDHIQAKKRKVELKIPTSIYIPSKIQDQVTEIEETISQGFGKIPSAKTTGDSEPVQEDTVLSFDFITDKELNSGRLGSKQLREHNLFKNYKTGDPSCRLYVKNLSKKATEKDMRYIFGKFVNFNDEEEAKMFDVRVMTQGRMKGQAFIGLPSVTAASKARSATNGYVLIGKPMVVAYARSAKPKESLQ